ncbi:MAG TPA: hypothetical protein VJN43_23320 [Bryobacteraceae bacterium]|nr:hypothetical protein [Bryobacteraceae bacterium]
MSNENNIREELLGRHLPQPGKLEDYRREVEQMLESRQKKFRRSTLANRIGGVACLVTAVILMLAAGSRNDTFLAVSACFWFIFFLGVAMHWLIGESRLELLKELKQAQLQILELRVRLDQRSAE